MINCLLIDDEPYALELLRKYIAEFNDMHVVASCRGVQEAIPVLQAEQVDLLFLDVKMPGVTGIDFIREASHLPEIILTTAYREYALDAYELGVLDYLLKPVSFVRFAKAIERYKEKYAARQDIMKKAIVFKSGFEYHKVLPEDILYIQSIKEYMSVVCKDNKYLVRCTMKDMLQQLPDNHFIQVHKSYIVPAMQIESVLSSEIVLANSERIPLGRAFSRQVKAMFSNEG